MSASLSGTTHSPGLKKLGLAATASLAVLIAVLALIPMPNTGPPGSDKAHHALAFAALAFPLSAVGYRPVALVLLGAIAYGGLIEVLQPLVGRSAEWADFHADILGAIFGVGLGLGIGSIFRRRQNRTSE